MYTAYLTYPPLLDTRIKNIYSSISERWKNKRDFEFLPMIPVWKVYADDSTEPEIIKNVGAVAPNLELPLKTNGLLTKPDSGYIFITFDTTSSQQLTGYSEAMRIAMRVKDSEDNMPYGYEPHSSLIKQEVAELDSILAFITDKLEAVVFTPKSLIISRATDTDNGITFDVLFEHSFIQHTQ